MTGGGGKAGAGGPKALSPLDRGGWKELALGQEGTAGVVRAYFEGGLNQGPQPARLYLIGPMFRYDRPQKGRYRQFFQFNVEAIGGGRPAGGGGGAAPAPARGVAAGPGKVTLQHHTIAD